MGRLSFNGPHWKRLPVNSSHGHLVTIQHCTKLRVGTQNSVGMQILMVTTNVQNLGAPDPQREIARGWGGSKCFSLTPPPSKFSCQIFEFFHILLTTIRPTNGEKCRKIVGSFSRKFHLKIAKFQILPIIWLGDF